MPNAAKNCVFLTSARLNSMMPCNIHGMTNSETEMCKLKMRSRVLERAAALEERESIRHGFYSNSPSRANEGHAEADKNLKVIVCTVYCFQYAFNITTTHLCWLIALVILSVYANHVASQLLRLRE